MAPTAHSCSMVSPPCCTTQRDVSLGVHLTGYCLNELVEQTALTDVPS